jgi:transmembrane sensor
MDSRQIEETAADWLAKRDGGAWTEADAAAFSTWQSEATAHRVAVIRLKTVWQRADRLQALGAGVPSGTVPAPGRWRLSQNSILNAAKQGRARMQAFLSAAAVLLITSICYFTYSYIYDPNAYRTAIGDIESVHLADGSQLVLNTNSRIRVSLNEAERRIELDRGEVFFDVVQDPTRPFIVQAGEKRIIAIGTKFSVLRERNAFRVVVTEGRVRIQEDALDLAAGSIARASTQGVRVARHSIPEVEQTLSWRSGYILLRNTALAEAVAEFNRYNERQLVIGDRSLADLRVGGNLRLTNLDAFVRVLEQGFPVQAQREDARIILKRR